MALWISVILKYLLSIRSGRILFPGGGKYNLCLTISELAKAVLERSISHGTIFICTGLC